MSKVQTFDFCLYLKNFINSSQKKKFFLSTKLVDAHNKECMICSIWNYFILKIPKLFKFLNLQVVVLYSKMKYKEIWD